METDSRGVARVVGGATLLSREFIESAHVAIRPHVRETPLEPSPYLTELTGAEVFLKLENYQVTGSFKARGAMHKLTRLDAEARGRGVICASSGNHGAAVAYGAQKLGLASTVCVPEYASSTKVDVIRRFGAEVQFFGDDCVKTEGYARKVGQERGLTYVSPYNDVDVAAGQGTIGVELSAQLDGMDVVFIALGGRRVDRWRGSISECDVGKDRDRRLLSRKVAGDACMSRGGGNHRCSVWRNAL